MRQEPMDQNAVTAVSACLALGDRFVLVRRAHAPMAGLWSFPGGKVQLGETPGAALEREIREETGLVVRAMGFMAVHSVLTHRIGVHWARAEGVPQAGDDAQALRLARLDEIRALDAAGQTTGGLGDFVTMAIGFMARTAEPLADMPADGRGSPA